MHSPSRRLCIKWMIVSESCELCNCVYSKQYTLAFIDTAPYFDSDVCVWVCGKLLSAPNMPFNNALISIRMYSVRRIIISFDDICWTKFKCRQTIIVIFFPMSFRHFFSHKAIKRERLTRQTPFIIQPIISHVQDISDNNSNYFVHCTAHTFLLHGMARREESVILLLLTFLSLAIIWLYCAYIVELL